MMSFLGDTPATPRMNNALHYIETNWALPPTDGFIYLSTWSQMKGLTYSGVTLLDLDHGGTRNDNWFNEEPSRGLDLASYIVGQQAVNGSWPSSLYEGSSDYLSTAFALLILERAAPPPPTSISEIVPNAGPVAGGTSVVITGTGLISATALTFGGLPAPTWTVITDTQITATTPAHAAGPVDVVITTPSKVITSTGGFTYYDVPTISNGGAGGGIAPNAGPLAGGTTVVITGTHLLGATSVTFGGTPANLAACTVTDTSITCPTPPHAAGAVNVVVTTPGGTATSTGGFTYVPPPTIGGIAPNSGPTTGGTTVVITGTGFTNGTITFGGVAATCTVNSNTQVTCTTPPHAAGPVNVVITTAGGTATSTGGFTYIPVSITGIAPNSGPVSGGTSVVITGTGFTGGTFTFGGIPAVCTVVSDTQATCTTPGNLAHGPGAVDVVVTIPGGSATSTDGFTYLMVNTTSVVVSSKNPSLDGQTVTFHATVSAVAPGSGTPTGMATFYDGGTVLGTRALTGGQASFTPPYPLAVGTHDITVLYGGDMNYNGSTSAVLQQVVVHGTDLEIHKSMTLNYPDVTFTIVAANNDCPCCLPADGAIVSDTLPANLTNVTWTCEASGGATCAASGTASIPGNIYDTLTSFPAGGVVTYTVHARATGGFANTAEIIPPAYFTDAIPANNRSTVTSYLVINKTATDLNGAPLYGGDMVRYAIVVTNTSGSTMTGVKVTDMLPSGAVFASASPAGYTSPNPLVWQVGNLAAGATWTGIITVTVDPAVATLGANVAEVSSDQQGEVATPPVLPPGDGTVLPGLLINKTVTDLDGAPLYAGDMVRYAIVVTNTNGSTMTGVKVTDMLPSGAVFASASPAGYTSPNPLVWQVGNLAAGATWTGIITVTVDPAAATLGGNVAEVSSDQQGTLSTNPVLPPGGGAITPKADLSVAESVARTLNGIAYTIVARNSGPSATNGAVVSSFIPAEVTNITWTCRASGGATCSDGAGNALQDTLAALPAGGVMTYTVKGTLGILDRGSNIVTITAPAGVFDPDLSNNRATYRIYQYLLPLMFKN